MENEPENNVEVPEVPEVPLEEENPELEPDNVQNEQNQFQPDVLQVDENPGEEASDGSSETSLVREPQLELGGLGGKGSSVLADLKTEQKSKKLPPMLKELTFVRTTLGP